jgi:hypothetical protein
MPGGIVKALFDPSMISSTSLFPYLFSRLGKRAIRASPLAFGYSLITDIRIIVPDPRVDARSRFLYMYWRIITDLYTYKPELNKARSCFFSFLYICDFKREARFA